MKSFLKYFLFMTAIAFISYSCEPAYRANIDYAMSGGILWPGPPEKPRIKYLWSVSSLTPQTSLVDFIAGGGDPSDPKSSPSLLRPNGVFFRDNRLYVTDFGAQRLTIIDTETNDVMQTGLSGKGELTNPVCVTVDNSGNIYVTDSVLNKVFVYDSHGSFLKTFSSVEFQRPTGIAYDRINDLIYIVDTMAHGIYVFDREGNLKNRIGKRGTGDSEFNYPTYINVDRLGTACVSDTLNFRVQCFDSKGKFLFKFGDIGDSFDRFSMPKGIATDTEGNIYVVDAGQEMIKIFDRKGRLLLFFGEKGGSRGSFSLPSGIYIDSNDNIYVADTYNLRVQAFSFLGGKP